VDLLPACCDAVSLWTEEKVLEDADAYVGKATEALYSSQ
jgi:hypothetical protein